ncbi:MAG TPA: S9 family peptidase [Vicinamibacterales bacterium]|jgi:dipeptidyl aminopeptidase/acylaminoacyl peptidase|nr:S9 family peptidase [Vicinamibacterales bacterium]
MQRPIATKNRVTTAWHPLRTGAVSLLVALSLSSAAHAQKRGFIATDYYKEVVPSDVAISPAGDMVAFTVTTVVEKENRRHREVWVARLRNGAPDGAPFRFTDPTADSASPRWAPDGSVLSFTSRRGKDPNDVWFVSIAQPAGEARHIDGVTAAPVWSPDGKWIAFEKSPSTRTDDSEKKDPHEGWIAADAHSRTLDAKRFDGRVLTNPRYKRDGTLEFLPDPSIHAKTQLFVVAAGGGSPRQVTHTAFDVGSVVWSADSRTIFFTGDEHQDDNVLGRDQQTAIYAVGRDGGDPRKLTTDAGAHTQPAVSPDGTHLAFLKLPKQGEETDVMVADIGPDGAFRGQPANLTGAWDDIPGAPMWSADSRAVRFAAGLHGNNHLYEAPLSTKAVKAVTSGERHLQNFSASRDGAVLAYIENDVTHPGDVFVSRADGSSEQRVTSLNDGWLADIRLAPAERLSWKVSGGVTVEGWVMKPLDYTPGKKYPMILKIHGGPYGAYGTGWFDQFQMLSASGFFVLFTNPRGSTGYGHAFQWATRGKWGEVDREDYLGGVDAALAKYPDVDPRRVGISGGSYGGFMTNWLTATVPDRWAAAVTARSIATWESWYGSSDAQGLTEHAFFGPPWEQRDLYRRLSPISYVEKVKAPTLILLGENDYRTPISDNEQWFMALRKRNVPAELVRYPRSSHGLSRMGEPWLLVDRLERIRSWFQYWLIDQPARPSTQP